MSDTTRTGNGSEMIPRLREGPSSLLNVIARAMEDERFDVAKLEALLKLQEKLVAEQARQAFSRAMSEAQGEMRAVFRDAANEQTRSRYAKLETIDDSIRPIYTRHGFSLTFGTDQPRDPASIRVVCDCAHSDGHVKQYELEAPPDMTGARGQINKTTLHGMGSTITYLRRYLTTMIFNVVLTNEDDDGNAGGISAGMAENVERRPRNAAVASRMMDNFDRGEAQRQDERRQAEGPTQPRRTARQLLEAIQRDADAALTMEDLEALHTNDEVRAISTLPMDHAARGALSTIIAAAHARLAAFEQGQPAADDSLDDALPPTVDVDAKRVAEIVALIGTATSAEQIDRQILGSNNNLALIDRFTRDGRKDFISQIEAARQARLGELGAGT